MELSLCMIVRDEESCLERCLLSVKEAVDEIVILDTGSRDATRTVARRYADRVEDYAWQDDFSAARNASFALATKPYILWLDADDVIEDEQRMKLLALKPRLDGSVDAVMMPYHYAHDENGAVTMTFERERIVRRDAGFRFEGIVHEAMAVGGRVLHEDIAVRHTRRHSAGRRNLELYERARARGIPLSARDLYYYARELDACGETERAQRAYAAFLARPDGWAVNREDAHIERGRLLYALGRGREGKAEALCAMADGAPRAEALCAMGEICLGLGELEAAEFWYRAALGSEKPGNGAAFTNPAAYGYIPAMQLCVIYDRMGKRALAEAMNERALLERPNDAAALKNQRYFAENDKNGSGR
ncbi:MAG: glycosyltransferase family 2 protein [Clostridia bacterium]|nr:glycosyltransferase family 2 protein [Clostridia bacterium]